MTTATAYAYLAEQAKRDEAFDAFMKHWNNAWPAASVELCTNTGSHNDYLGGPRDGVAKQVIMAYINSNQRAFFETVAEWQSGKLGAAKKGAGL